MNFIEKITKASILGYKNIDLEPCSQTYVSVIFKKDQVYLTSIEGWLENMSAEQLINEFCGKLLVNNIDCQGYIEASFLNKREYNFDKILNSELEDFGGYYYETLLRFANLCKAIATKSLKTGKIFFVEMIYGEHCLEYYTEEKGYDVDIPLEELEFDKWNEKWAEHVIRDLNN